MLPEVKLKISLQEFALKGSLQLTFENATGESFLQAFL